MKSHALLDQVKRNHAETLARMKTEMKQVGDVLTALPDIDVDVVLPATADDYFDVSSIFTAWGPAREQIRKICGEFPVLPRYVVYDIMPRISLEVPPNIRADPIHGLTVDCQPSMGRPEATFTWHSIIAGEFVKFSVVVRDFGKMILTPPNESEIVDTDYELPLKWGFVGAVTNIQFQWLRKIRWGRPDRSVPHRVTYMFSPSVTLEDILCGS